MIDDLIPFVSLPEGREGQWAIEKFEVPPDAVGTISFALKGRAIRPGEYTRLVHQERGVVMSDTPAEKRDHVGFVHNAKGHVLINGLGIGMCLGAALAKLEVERVTVVEIDPDVIALVGGHYAADSRVQIVNASAFEYKPPRGIRYGAVWHDIWDDMCSDNLPEMMSLHRKYGKLADWQGSWGRWECERQRVTERAFLRSR